MPSTGREVERKKKMFLWRLRVDFSEFSFDTVRINAFGEVGKVVQLPNLIYIQLNTGLSNGTWFSEDLTIYPTRWLPQKLAFWVVKNRLSVELCSCEGSSRTFLTELKLFCMRLLCVLRSQKCHWIMYSDRSANSFKIEVFTTKLFSIIKGKSMRIQSTLISDRFTFITCCMCSWSNKFIGNM